MNRTNKTSLVNKHMKPAAPRLKVTKYRFFSHPLVTVAAATRQQVNGHRDEFLLGGGFEVVVAEALLLLGGQDVQQLLTIRGRIDTYM